jgi:lipopolysaccharide biosynthesis regulator YciM
VTLPAPGLTATTPPPTADKLADLIQAQILRARTTGDPRFLGYSEGLFQQWQGVLTDRLRVLRATVQQSLHNFDQARDDLTQVIGTTSDRQQRIQALLMLANIELVQGEYQAAAKYCNQLEQQLPGLIAASCQAQTQARTGQPEAARLAEALRERFAEAQWRGNLLHQRDFARFQLDIDGNADAALNNARGNWRDQREPLDTRLLLRAAIAAGDQSQLNTTRAWLQSHGQTDARYPESGS